MLIRTRQVAADPHLTDPWNNTAVKKIGRQYWKHPNFVNYIRRSRLDDETRKAYNEHKHSSELLSADIGKKGQAMGIGGLQGVAIAFVLVTVTLGIGAYLVNEVGDQLPSGSIAENVTTDGLNALDTFGGWLGILVVVVVAAVVLGLLALYQRFG